jgi:glycerophosphoryl diester phosphodiesterase
MSSTDEANCMAPTIVIAHRGASNHAPENTLLAFETAIRLGAQMFELDVQETADNYLVCIHDYTVDRTTSGNGLVSELTLEELRSLDAGRGEKIPLLSEVLDLARQRIMVNVELKVMEVEERVLDLISSRGMLDAVIVSSFLHETLAVVHKICPTICTGVLYAQTLDDPLRYAQELGATAINPLHELVDLEIVSAAKEQGLAVYPWTVNESYRMAELVRLGVDGIITDLPDQCLRVIKRCESDSEVV